MCDNGPDYTAPSVLVSNDDGIEAPGIVALVSALVQAAFEVHVVAPRSEQSAKSQALTLGCPHVVEEMPDTHPGAASSFSVHGTPADAVMVATSSALVQEDIDMVVSGINRGDNLGLHVLYSGTVGAAREAACKGKAAMAFSLNNYRATTPADYEDAALYCVHLIRAALQWPGAGARVQLRQPLRGNVVNVNVPHRPHVPPEGFYLAHMSTASMTHRFVAMPDERRRQVLQQKGLEVTGSLAVMTACDSAHRKDQAHGGDTWAVTTGWVAVTPLALLQDYALQDEHALRGQAFVACCADVVQAAAKAAGVQAGGCERKVLQLPDGMPSAAGSMPAASL